MQTKQQASRIVSRCVNSAPHFFVLLCFAQLAACAAPGRVYEPACIAFAGDRVSLAHDRFEWHKFTDQIEIGEDGEIIDPFPGYPKRGSYSLVDNRVEFRPDDGSRIDDHFMVERLDIHYMLNEAQHQDLLARGALAPCALRISDPDG